VRSTISVILAMIVFSVSSLAQMKPVGPKSVKKDPVANKPVKVNPLKLPDGYNTGQVSGNLKNGTKLSTLRWAERSSVACFPGTRFEQFTGNHVFYRITLPPASSMKIKVVAKNGKAINLYALRQGMRRQSVPPNVTSAISCEASYPIYANLASGRRVHGKKRETKVEYISIRSAYSILIGVAGANGLTEGDFDLQIEIKSR
jgi:hypothetical protein